MKEYVVNGNTIEDTIECHITKMVNFLVEEDEGNAVYQDHFLEVIEYEDPSKTILATCYMLYDGSIETPENLFDIDIDISDDFFDNDDDEISGLIEDYDSDYLRYHGDLPTIDSIVPDMTVASDLATFIWNERYEQKEIAFIETGQQSIGDMKNHLCWSVLNSLLSDYNVSLDDEKFFEYLKNEKPSWESFRSTMEKIIELYPVN